MLNNLRLFFLLLLFSISAFCQTENLKWKKADISYEMPDEFRHRDYSFESDNVGGLIKKSFANAYWFFISDIDGDNCPFHPTCSAFLIESVEGTDIFQGTLMFFDRFTRDMNVYKRNEHYPKVKSGRYYDPSVNYMLSKKRIEFIPSSTVVKD
jgi:putative component of membrane protein insertase Oxa1/YidC/SpoIIIJ protein YidD